MKKLPRIEGRTVIRVLTDLGFEVARTKGSHNILKHPDGRVTVVPVHSGETIGPGLLTKILKDCDLTREEFEARL